MNASNAHYRAGFGKVDITPNEPFPLGGYGNYNRRIFDKILDHLYLTCVAVGDEKKTLLLFTCDSLFWYREMSITTREMVAKATGIPEENMFFTATHTHGAPMMSMADKYRDQLKVWAIEAAQKALADLSDTQISYGSKQVDGLNFVRHYICPDGTYVGSNFNTEREPDVVAHAGVPDKQLHVVKFARTEEKKDIILVNWQAHPDHTSENGYRTLTADYPGALRDKLEADTGALVAYFSGASGNVTAHSKIRDEEHGLKCVQYGHAIAGHALSVLEDMTPMTTPGIYTRRRVVTVNVDHSWDHMLPQAQEIAKLRDEVGRDAATPAAKAYGFTSPYQADAIIYRATWDKTAEMELNAFSIGDIGFANGTYEMFSDSSIFIKENSPFATTLVIEGNLYYLPSEAAFNYRCYEADTGYYEKGTSEKNAQGFVSMLQELSEERKGVL